LTYAEYPRYVAGMKSQVAAYAEQQLIEDARRMTREQRLIAFMEHCRAMEELRAAGERTRELARSGVTAAGESQ
jgi:hypothetical protein